MVCLIVYFVHELPHPNEEVANLLAETLEEEKQTDLDLTEIAENNINWEAEQEDEEDDEA